MSFLACVLGLRCRLHNVCPGYTPKNFTCEWYKGIDCVYWKHKGSAHTSTGDGLDPPYQGEDSAPPYMESSPNPLSPDEYIQHKREIAREYAVMCKMDDKNGI